MYATNHREAPQHGQGWRSVLQLFALAWIAASNWDNKASLADGLQMLAAIFIFTCLQCKHLHTLAKAACKMGDHFILSATSDMLQGCQTPAIPAQQQSQITGKQGAAVASTLRSMGADPSRKSKALQTTF
jgi:hypothetical protein